MTGNNLVFCVVITAILLTCIPVASASSYTLGVFGNANEDDTIDLNDVEYTASVILGLDDQTQLADAKYDGEVDILDMIQTELIILGVPVWCDDNDTSVLWRGRGCERSSVLDGW